MRKLFVKIAMARLTARQQEILARLGRRHQSFWQILAYVSSSGEDFLQANRMNPALGTSVLKQQIEHEKQEEAETSRLIEECRQAGIAWWRIWLVK